jgi:hypothetical protein
MVWLNCRPRNYESALNRMPKVITNKDSVILACPESLALQSNDSGQTGMTVQRAFGTRAQCAPCLCLLLLLCLFACAGSKKASQENAMPAPVEISARTDRTTATISEPITFTLAASYARGQQVTLPEVGAKIAGLRITDFGEDGPREIDNRLEHKKWYKLQADMAGTYIIPSLAVTYAADNGTRELKTPQIFIEVKSTLKEGPDAPKDIVDIQPLELVPFNWKPYIWGGSAAAMLLVLGAGAFIWYRKSRKKAEEVKKPAHVLALEEIEKLKSEHLVEKGIVREHYFRLSDIFRHYIENRFSIPAIEQTTQELLPAIMRLAALNDTAKSGMRQFLQHSDMVKFAKYLPPQDEIAANEQKVVRLIEETKLEEAPPQAETPKQ